MYAFFKSESRERNSVTLGIINYWFETTLLTILSKYHLKDRYNGNDFLTLPT